MKFSVFDTPTDTVFVDGRAYRVNASFDRVLAAYEVLQDTFLDDYQKASVCVDLLYKRIKKCHTPRQTLQLFEAYFDQIVKEENRGKAETKAFDFVQDAPLIYAAFWQAYGIDLHKQKGKLHWRQFVALFCGLPDHTRIMQIIDIRIRPLPKPTKYNFEERQALMRAKAQVRLKVSEEERLRNYAQGLWSLARMLEQRAQNKGG